MLKDLLATALVLICTILESSAFAQSNLGTEMQMMKAGEKQGPFIDTFAKLAREQNEKAVMTLFDSKLIKDFGEEQLRKSLTNEVFPFFSHYDKLRNYEQITGASVDDGRVGLWHYTFIVDTEGKVLPFQIAIIDTENGPKVLSLLVGQCVKGRHPRIPPCQ